jgi:tRNA1Val (adenine37-N6)-methyltransferase
MSFQFKQFKIEQDHCAMKVTTDGCLFGAWCANKIKNQESKVKNTLDIGTGTGLLSLMAAQQNPKIQIDAIEIDQEATSQANQNVLASPWSEQVHVFYGDARQFRYPGKYEAIISNPPFYENEWRSPDEKKNIAHHSDDLGLADLFSLTHKQLTEDGKFYFLFPYKRKEQVESLLKKEGLYIHALMLAKQTTQHDYFRMMIEGGLEVADEIITDEMAIKDEKNEYTTAFVSLLKDYYLHL